MYFYFDIKKSYSGTRHAFRERLTRFCEKVMSTEPPYPIYYNTGGITMYFPVQDLLGKAAKSELRKSGMNSAAFYVVSVNYERDNPHMRVYCKTTESDGGKAIEELLNSEIMCGVHTGDGAIYDPRDAKKECGVRNMYIMHPLNPHENPGSSFIVSICDAETAMAKGPTRIFISNQGTTYEK